ncbi:urease accessory protein [Streptacidiphilus sp. MAP12-20]|uniref:urease accessory protein UreD n=1 Tax=Streptacidiphilus sp. MAP12-20 TaxID=3156299 RepID=UPI00351486BE
MSSVSAVARIVAAPDRRGGTALPVLVGDGPIALRRSRHPGDEAAAHVVVVGAMAAPLGGDRLRIEVVVEPGARLRVTSAAATVSLPGREPAAAHYELDLAVGRDAELEWLPEPVIAAAGSELRLWTRIRLDEGARLLFREEQVLGRHGELPGRLAGRLTVRQRGRLVLDQSTDLGGSPSGAPGWDGPAVLAHHRALGQLLTTGHAPFTELSQASPQGREELREKPPCADGPAHAGTPAPTDRPRTRPTPALPAVPGVEAAAFPLGDGLTLLTALAPDALALRAALRVPLQTDAPTARHICSARSRNQDAALAGADFGSGSAPWPSAAPVMTTFPSSEASM